MIPVFWFTLLIKASLWLTLVGGLILVILWIIDWIKKKLW